MQGSLTSITLLSCGRPQFLVPETHRPWVEHECERRRISMNLSDTAWIVRDNNYLRYFGKQVLRW